MTEKERNPNETFTCSSCPVALRGVFAAWSCIFSCAESRQTPATLDAVLKKMDAMAANFTSAQADFEWDIYQKVIDEVDDVETGTIYYRRTGKGD